MFNSDMFYFCRWSDLTDSPHIHRLVVSGKANPRFLFYSLHHEKRITLFSWRSTNASCTENFIPTSISQLLCCAWLISLASCCFGASALGLAAESQACLQSTTLVSSVCAQNWRFIRSTAPSGSKLSKRNLSVSSSVLTFLFFILFFYLFFIFLTSAWSLLFLS